MFKFRFYLEYTNSICMFDRVMQLEVLSRLENHSSSLCSKVFVRLFWLSKKYLWNSIFYFSLGCNYLTNILIFFFSLSLQNMFLMMKIL